MKSALYLTRNGTNLFLKPLVSLIIVDANKAFLLQVGEDLSNYITMAIMDKLNRTVNTSTEGVEKAAYVGTISTARTDGIDKLTGAELGSPAKRLKPLCLQIWRPFKIL